MKIKSDFEKQIEEIRKKEKELDKEINRNKKYDYIIWIVVLIISLALSFC